MLYLKQLFKAILDPKGAFEELKGSVGIKEGVIAWGFSMVVGFMLAYMVAYNLKFPVFMLDFGVGRSIEAINILKGAGFGLVVLVIVAFLANIIAKKLGGTGDFKETLGMLGYTKGLAIVQGIVSSGISVTMWIMITQMAVKGAQGISAPTNFLLLFTWPTYILIGMFLVWGLLLESYALSVSNEISMKKAVPIMLVLTIIINTAVGVLAL